jgi:AhpD family alkylhydroperoxidase
MEKRIDFAATEPEAIKALMGLEKYLGTTQLSPTHKELIKMRASQINGCAYCLDMHARDARKYGETEQRLYVLSAWRETDLFTEEERAILALTEEMTLLHRHGVSDETYARAAQLFDANHLAQIMMAIVAINAWNRIGVPTHMKPVRES